MVRIINIYVRTYNKHSHAHTFWETCRVHNMDTEWL